ncbi:FAD-dependent oxidoreductase [Nocardia sp. NPDC058176]|uniref:FAD-dependent oxidoreductase n=1 Tax=Nocardia sp. NPDC058176 TaxID=3346368 RepID=UPI0036D94D00
MRIAVVGGGISGLVAAYRLRQRLGPRADIVVLERGDRVGGVLRTGELAGEPLDLGAEAFVGRRPEVVELMAELGLDDQLVRPAGKRPLVWSGGVAHPLPPRTLMGIPSDAESMRGLVDAETLARIAAEPTRPLDWRPGTDIDVYSLIADRFGAQVAERSVDPLLGGVYAGTSATIGVRAAVPPLAAALDRGATSLTEAARAALPAPSNAPVFGGLRDGYGALVDALIEASGAAIVTTTAATRIARGRRVSAPVNDTWTSEPAGSTDDSPYPAGSVGDRSTSAGSAGDRSGTSSSVGDQSTSVGSVGDGSSGGRAGSEIPVGGRSTSVGSAGDRSGESGSGGGRSTSVGWVVDPIGRVDAVVLATPAPITARLLRAVDPIAAEAVAGIELSSSALVALALPHDTALPDNSGILIATGEPLRAKAFTLSSRKWPHLAERDVALVRASFGRFGDESPLTWSDDELIAAAVTDLSTVTGIPITPLEAVVQRWPGGLPQYAPGHTDRIATLESAVASLDGLAVAGAYLHGVGVPACVAAGTAAADRIVTSLGSHV